MSADPPSEITLEKPMPFGRAQSSIAVQIAPDCDTSASDPALALPRPNVALRPRLGPHDAQAVRAEEAHANAAARRRAPRARAPAPAGPVSEKPAVITTAALVPARPAVLDHARHRRGGGRDDHEIDRLGQLRDRRVARHPEHAARASGSPRRARLDSARRRMFSMSTRPIAPARSVAPDDSDRRRLEQRSPDNDRTCVSLTVPASSARGSHAPCAAFAAALSASLMPRNTRSRASCGARAHSRSAPDLACRIE